MNSLLVLGVLVLAGFGIWWYLQEPPLEPGQLRVTYQHGEVCRWQDWTFKVRRQVPNNRVMGNAMMVLPPSIETKADDWLRVYSPTGEKLYLQPETLREMRFKSREAQNNSSRNAVTSLELVTESESIVFTAVELPKLSRSRILVPVASRFFPDHSDDYMSWGNVRMTLAGSPEAECTVRDELSLTRPDHSKKRTPVLVEFGYRS